MTIFSRTTCSIAHSARGEKVLGIHITAVALSTLSNNQVLEEVHGEVFIVEQTLNRKGAKQECHWLAYERRYSEIEICCSLLSKVMGSFEKLL